MIQINDRTLNISFNRLRKIQVNSTNLYYSDHISLVRQIKQSNFEVFFSLNKFYSTQLDYTPLEFNILVNVLLLIVTDAKEPILK